MAGRFFDPESFAWKPFGYIADLLILSMLWILCSLPVFTLGAAGTALYDAVAHAFRYKEAETISRFFRTFKKEYKLATLSLLLLGSVWAACYFALRSFISIAPASTIAAVAAVAGQFLLLIPTGVLCWAFPLLSRFGFNWKGLLATSVKLSFAHLPSTLVMALSAVGAVWLSLRFLVPLFFMPALLCLFLSLFLERVFQTYMD